MIKINDLRIGNWVNYEGQGLKIYRIDINGWLNEPIQINQKTYRVIAEHEISPIPITKHIIENLFFECIGHNVYKLRIENGFPFTESVIVRIFPNESDNWATLRDAVNDKCEICIATSFHQLQNLYYLISGKEILGMNLKLVNIDKKWVIRHKDL